MSLRRLGSLMGDPRTREKETVQYDSANHIQVLTKMYGSVWPKVIPYCFLNVAIAGVIQWLNTSKGIDLTTSDQSHSFMNLLVAFLVVSRVSISTNRYYEARGCLGVMYRESRELLQTMAVQTRKMQTSSDKDWRSETAYRVLLLLLTAMAVVDYKSDKVAAWEIPELDPEEAKEIEREMNTDFGSHKKCNDFENTMRTPVLMAFKLRCCIDSASERLSGTTNELRELKLYDSIDTFMEGYYAIQKFVTTPFPFPLVQMARTFLFFYIFTVPFALLSDVSNPAAHLLVIFFLTYGFLGLEFVAVELDDPFGHDPNDFNNIEMAHTVIEDTYIIIKSVDGDEYVTKLRTRLRKNAYEPQASGEDSWLLENNA